MTTQLSNVLSVPLPSPFLLRKHHCRSCGTLVCDACSSKRLQLVVIPPETDSEDVGGLQAEMATEFQLGHRASFMSTHSKASRETVCGRSTSNSIRSSAGVGAVVSPGQSKKERTCDSCFTKPIS